MVDVSYSPESPTTTELGIDSILPEDNVERLRNIRDMFESSANYNEELILQKVEKVQPSEKLIDRLTNGKEFAFDEFDDEVRAVEEEDEEEEEEDVEMSNLVDKTINRLDEMNLYFQQTAQSQQQQQPMSALEERDDENVGEEESQEKCDGAHTTAQSIIKDNFVLKEHQRSINGDATSPSMSNMEDLGLLLASKAVDPLLVNTTTVVGTVVPLSSNSNDKNNNNINISSSSSSSVSSSLSSASSPYEAAHNPIATNNGHISDQQQDDDELNHLHALNNPNNNNNTEFPHLHILNENNRFEEGAVEDEQEEEEDNAEEGPDGIVRNRRKSKKKDIIAFADLNNVKTKFENIGNQPANDTNAPKPLRSITPPREGANRVEIENEPMQRSEDVVSVYEKLEDKLPESGYARSRKELFDSVAQGSSTTSDGVPRVKSITPPREEALKRVLKETTPERNENVFRESDRNDDVLPSAGSIKQTAAMFTGRQKSIDRSGITIEGELLEKGIAKSRLALFNDPSALNQSTHSVNTTELESDIMKNASGIAKERLNLFKNLEQSGAGTRTSPSRDQKKLKEFTPPPQLDHQQRQYIIINNEDDQTDANGKVPYVDELAIIGKGHAKSALAKFEQSVVESSTFVRKSITPPKEFINKSSSNAVKSVFESQPLESNVNAVYTEEEVIPSAGMAKQLKNKFLTLEKEASKVETASSKMTYVPKKFTAPSSPTTTNAPVSLGAKKQNGSNSSTNGLLTTATASPNGQANGHAANQQNNGEKCCVCEKTVYAMEKIEADKKVYHKTCFKCTSCNCPLKLGNFSSIKQTLYCTPHYIQLFARNGNYDEGFGLENYKRKWLQRTPDHPTSTTSTTSN